MFVVGAANGSSDLREAAGGRVEEEDLEITVGVAYTEVRTGPKRDAGPVRVDRWLFVVADERSSDLGEGAEGAIRVESGRVVEENLPVAVAVGYESYAGPVRVDRGIKVGDDVRVGHLGNTAGQLTLGHLRPQSRDQQR